MEEGGRIPDRWCSNTGKKRLGRRWSQFLYTVSQKNLAKLFLSELRHISTNFDNFWQKDGKKAKRQKVSEMHSFSTSPNSCHHATVLNADVPDCYTTLKVF